MQALETWNGYNKVTLVWTPGHNGILRNEEADKLGRD
jgi:ribonuclease HI